MKNLDKTIEIKLECAFCNSTEFELPYEGYQPYEGEMLKCSNCGRLNDFSAIKEVAIDTGREELKEYAHHEIEKELKKILKKFK